MNAFRVGMIFLLFLNNNIFCMEEVPLQSKVSDYIRSCVGEIDQNLPLSYFCVSKKLLHVNLEDKGNKVWNIFCRARKSSVLERQYSEIYSTVETLVKELLDFDNVSQNIFFGKLQTISNEEKVLRAFIAKKILDKRAGDFCESIKPALVEFLTSHIGALRSELFENVGKNDFLGVISNLWHGDDPNCIYTHEIGGIWHLMTPLHFALHSRNIQGFALKKRSESTFILQALIAAGAFADAKTNNDDYLITYPLAKQDEIAARILIMAGTQIPLNSLHELDAMGISIVDTSQMVKS